MQINGTLYMAAPPDGNIRFKVYETDALGSPVLTKDYPAPVSNPLVFTLTVPNDVPHIVKIYDSPGTDDGTLLSDFLYDPTYTDIEVKADKFYSVGEAGAPEIGSTSFTDPDLEGYKFELERRGVGTLSPGIEWNYTANNDGFQLLITGDVFHEGETLVLHFYPNITKATPQQTGGGGFIKDIKILTTDTTLDDNYYNKLISIASVTNKIVITLPKIAETPANTLFPFTTNMGSQVNATIKVSGSDTIFWNNENKSAMYMGKNEQLMLIKGTDGWYVVSADGAFNDVGKMFYSDMAVVNTLERKGALLDRDVYPRLFHWYVNKLPLSMIVSESEWNHFSQVNKTKFTLGDGVTSFRIPDSRALFTRNNDSGRGIDSGRQIGTYQDDEIAKHAHKIAADDQGGGFQNKGNYLHYDIRSGSNSSNYSLSGGSPLSPSLFDTSEAGGEETRPINESRIALIQI